MTKTRPFLSMCYGDPSATEVPPCCETATKKLTFSTTSVLLLLNMPLSLSRATIFRRQKNPRRVYRPKIAGIVFVCNEPEGKYYTVPIRCYVFVSLTEICQDPARRQLPPVSQITRFNGVSADGCAYPITLSCAESALSVQETATCYARVLGYSGKGTSKLVRYPLGNSPGMRSDEPAGCCSRHIGQTSLFHVTQWPVTLSRLIARH